MKKTKNEILNTKLSPTIGFMDSYLSKKRTGKLRKGFTLIEVIIAMVLLAVVFATFMMAIVGVQSVNRRSASITDFMFETSQKNVDTKIDKVANYLELKAEIKALQKRYAVFISDPVSYPPADFADVINALDSSIRQKENELQDMEDHYQVMQHIESRTLTFSSKIDRTVEAYEFTSALTDYKKANMTVKDAKGKKLEGVSANTDNEFYSFGKLAGNTNLYYLFACDVPVATLPDPVIFHDNKPEYAYLGETIHTSYEKPPGNYDFQFFNYWHLSDSRVASKTADENSETDKSSRALYSERRHYKDVGNAINFSYIGDYWLMLLENDYCPVFRYEKLVSQKDNTITINDFKKQAGAFLAMGIQPARGTVGAAFPIQMSPSETYVVPIANMKNLNKHYSPNMMSMTKDKEHNHNILLRTLSESADKELTDQETNKPGVTKDGTIFNIMRNGKPEDAMVAPGVPHMGKYEAQFIPIWPINASSAFKEFMSIYPRQSLNNYEELQEKGRSDPMNEGRAAFMKIKSNFTDDASNYQSANVFKFVTPLNDISAATMKKELAAGPDKDALLPLIGENKVLVMNNMGFNALQVNNQNAGGVLFMKFYAGDVCDERAHDTTPQNQAILDKVTSPSLTKRVLENIKEEIPRENTFKAWDKNRYLCDLIRVGLEDRKSNPGMIEKTSIPMFALSYAFKTEPYVDNDGISQIALTAPLVLRYTGKNVDNNKKAQNGTKLWFQRPADEGLVSGEFGRNNADITRIDKVYKKFNKIPSTLIEPDKLNTITMIYKADYIGHSVWKRMMFSVYINGVAAGTGEIEFRHNNPSSYSQRDMVISLGGLGNLNMVEAIYYNEMGAFNVLQGFGSGSGNNSIRVPLTKFNNNQMGDFKQVQAYAELPDADGLLLDLLKEHKLREFEDLEDLFPEIN